MADLLQQVNLQHIGNMINDYDNMSFNGDYLNVFGTSYNYGLDYSNLDNINRKVYFRKY